MGIHENIGAYEELQNKAIRYDNAIQAQRAMIVLEMGNIASIISDLKNGSKSSIIDSEMMIDIMLEAGKLRGMSAYALDDDVSNTAMSMASDLLDAYSESLETINENKGV